MAPATRRSSGFGGQSLAQTNLDHILEHFNLFKRKHITQNRDIIKTNALAQLRIKELEDKVRVLEAERTERDLDYFRMQQQVERTEQASAAVQRGWQLIGAGLVGLPTTSTASSQAAQDLDDALAGGAGPLANGRVATDEAALRALFGRNDAHLRPSARVVLDPTVLPSGVTRAIARPPDEMQDIVEEDSADITISGEDADARYADGGNEAMEQGSTLPLGRDDTGSNQSSFAVEGDEGLTIGSTSYVASGDETRTPNESLEESQLLQVPASGSTARHRRANGVPGPSRLGSSAGVKTKKSADSLSSLGDEEMVQLSDDEVGEKPERESPAHDEQASASAAPIEERAHDQKDTAQASPSRRRRRRSSTAASPDSTDASSSPEQSFSAASGSESPTGPRSARLSMRNRRSVNYALPKLNTKMRKPDPVDRVPAKRDASRRSVSAPLRSRTGSDGDNSSLLDDGNSSTADGDNSQRPSIPKKKSSSRLRKGNGAASTGNLREIRRLHEQRSTNTDDDGVAAMKQLSLQGDDARAEVTSSSHEQSQMLNLEATLSPQSTPDMSSDGFEDVFSGQGDGREALLHVAPDRRSDSLSQSTPASASATHVQLLNLTSDLYGLAQTSVGTPIPKSGNRLGLGDRSNAGGIRAFKVAGRKAAPMSSGFGSGALTSSRANFMPAKTATTMVSNGNREQTADSAQGQNGRILTGSTRANTVPASVSAQTPSSHARHASGDVSTSSDPKRTLLPHHASSSSLHAAMTSPAPTVS